ncbi:MAG: hypothetical protein HQL52_18365 [Magnetococcales bacterium]|nr:hypothetical protein [Magnetococcales bacterium]
MAGSPPLFELKPIEATDYPEMARFCADFPGDVWDQPTWLARLRFWWEENPAFDEKWRRGWLMMDEGRIVGMLGEIPTLVRFFGEDRQVGNFSTWRVLEAYRGNGLKLLFRAVKLNRDLPMFTTTPTPKVAKIFSGFRFNNLTEHLDEQLYFCHLTPLVRRFAARMGPLHFLSGIPAILARLLQWFFFVWAKPDPGGLTTGPARVWGEPGPAFDRLWQRTRDRYDVTNVRQADVLRWRLALPLPEARIHLFGLPGPGGEVVGLARFMEEYPPAFPDERHLVCQDIWSEEAAGTVEMSAALLKAAVHFAKKEGISVVRIPHFQPHLARAGRRAGLFFHNQRVASLYCKFPKAIQLKIVPEKICLSGDMGDTGL